MTDGLTRMAWVNARRARITHSPSYKSDMVPRKGLEPLRYYYQRILSPSRLPFRHLGLVMVQNYITLAGSFDALQAESATVRFCVPLPRAEIALLWDVDSRYMIAIDPLGMNLTKCC